MIPEFYVISTHRCLYGRPWFRGADDQPLRAWTRASRWATLREARHEAARLGSEAEIWPVFVHQKSNLRRGRHPLSELEALGHPLPSSRT